MKKLIMLFFPQKLSVPILKYDGLQYDLGHSEISHGLSQI